MEMCRGREGRAGQWPATCQRSRVAPGEWLRFVWSSAGSRILNDGLVLRLARSWRTLAGQRKKNSSSKQDLNSKARMALETKTEAEAALRNFFRPVPYFTHLLWSK